MENTSLELVKTEDIQLLATTAPQALELNRTSVDKAVEMGNVLIAELNEKGMSAELDKKMNDYLVKVDITVKKMNDRRSPLTRLLTQITKAFTSLENSLDTKNSESVAYHIQQARNKWAATVAEEQRKAEAKRQLKINRENERINLKSVAQQKIREQFVLLLNGALATIQRLFNEINLTSFDRVESEIRAFGEVYPKGHFDGLYPEIEKQIVFNDDRLAGSIVVESKEGLYDKFYQEYMDIIQERKQVLIDMLPGRKTALEDAERARIEAEKAAELAKAAKSEADKKAAELAAQKAKEEQDRLAREAEDRRIAAERQAAIEAQDREKKAEEDRQAKAAAEKANTLFDVSMEAQSSTAETPRTREGYEITVMAQPGWLLVFDLWFRNEGSKLAMDKFEKKTLGSMKTWCEKHAHKTGERIDSPLVKYSETFTAVKERA